MDVMIKSIDYSKKQEIVEYLICLSGLTDIELDPSDFNDIDRVQKHLASMPNCKTIYVLCIDSRVIGTFGIFVEPKTIHNMASVAHIEDLVILKEYRGRGLGRQILQKIKEICQQDSDIYKIILECKPELVDFYKKEGFESVGYSMRFDII